MLKRLTVIVTGNGAGSQGHLSVFDGGGVDNSSVNTSDQLGGNYVG